MCDRERERSFAFAVSLALVLSAFMSSDLFAQPADHTVSHFFCCFHSFPFFLHRSTEPSSSFSTLSSCSELHNFFTPSLSLALSLFLSLFLSACVARLKSSNIGQARANQVSFLSSLCVSLFALL